MNNYLNVPKNHFLFTSESVSQGHPDKICDYVSDSILDACLSQDPESLVACETCVKNNMVMVFGEISTKAVINYECVVRQAIKQIGYDDINKGMDYKNCTVIVAIDTQSPDIFQCLNTEKQNEPENIGAGDQGLMIGYATNECDEMIPLTHLYANQLIKKLRECYENKLIPWLQPDAKTQVTIEYKKMENGEIKPIRVHTVLISTQHTDVVTNVEINAAIMKQVIQQKQYLDENTLYYINPSGKFIIGGPMGDAGLTGRKIIVDTYGGWGGHGGGAFSGKDATKVDRSAAYAVRWVAKSLVSNGFCSRCVIEVAYGIGVPHPISICVNSYGTCKKGYTDSVLQDIVLRNFDLRAGCIIRDLNLKRPIFNKTSTYGHFGRNDPDFTWEKSKDLSHEIRK